MMQQRLHHIVLILIFSPVVREIREIRERFEAEM